MVKQLIATGLLLSTMAMAQAPVPQLDIEGWRTLHPDREIHGITLWVDRAEALVDGTLVTLDHAPFVENEVFYLPVEEIARLHGDTVSVEGDTMIVETDAGPYTMYAGQTRVTGPDGTEYTVNHQLRRYSEQYDHRPITKDTTPRLRDGAAYLPAGFARQDQGAPDYLCGGFSWPWDGFLILDTPRTDEQMCDGFSTLTVFDELPEAQRAKVRETGSLGITGDSYDEVEYRGDGYAIHVARLRPGEEDSAGLDGIIVAIVIDGPQCATARGLRVGDTPQRAWELYGYLTQFGYEVSNGRITRIAFNSYYTQHSIPSFWI